VSAYKWIRVGAVLGVTGGVLRAVGSFAPIVLTSDYVRWLYATIDFCLAAGLCSVFLPRRHPLLSVGTVGFVLALLALAAVRVGSLESVDIYPVAAGGVAIGVLLLAVSESMARRVPGWVALALAVSLVIGGVGIFVAGAGALFVASGVIFGTAFVALPASALRRDRRS
jgi:hypothetical protein